MKKLIGPFFPLIFVLIFLLAAIPDQSLVAQENQGPPKIDSDPRLSPEDFYLPGHSEEAPVASDPEMTEDSFNYTLLTFMGLRDDNWEILTSDGHGNSVARRTYDGSSDVTPRFNYGATRIAFSSNRSGNYEIYTMNRWGSNIRRLTNNGSYDGNPSWSRDGTKILFESDRDGQSEIYRMNADGSGQTRLTYHGAYDGDPYYSPDGSKIVFTSRRNGDGIWVMNADGSNPSQLVWRRYSQNPVWSPDGSKIAFDADSSGDGWQEIWVMNANGSNQHQIYSSGSQIDPYVRSWSPDGRYIAFTWTQWINYKGNWYWTSGRPSYVEAQGGYSSYFNYDLDVDWYPDWQVTDILPPETNVNPLPEYSGDEITVSWGGNDPGGSGIQHYDVQYRIEADGSWQDWYAETTYTSATFGSLPGKTVYFRCRATDKVGHVEAWPEGDGDTHTTFYTWKISGQAVDNRLLPLPGVTVTTTQDYFEIVPSNEDGAYGAYFAGYDLNYAIAFNRVGYGSPALTTFPRTDPGVLDVLMPPVDNILADPDFEAADFSSENWSAGGLYTPTLVSDQSHTGEQSVFLGLKSDLETVAHFEADVKFTDQAGPRQDASGQFHAVWHVYNPAGGRTLYYATGDGDGNWSVPVSLAPFITNVANLLWDVSDDGKVHVIWEDNQPSYDIIRHTWMDESGWHDPQIVYNIGRINLKAFRLDSQGGGHLLWHLSSSGLSDSFYVYANPLGNWSAPDRLYDPYDTEPYNIVLDKNDVVHLQWSYSGDDLIHNYRQPDGSWSELETVVYGGYNWTNDLLIDDNNGVHLVWAHTSGKVYHSKRQSDGTWSSPAHLSAGLTADDYSLEAIAGPGGKLTVAWKSDDYSCRRIFTAQIDAGGIWTETNEINTGTSCPSEFWLERFDNLIRIMTDRKSNDEHEVCQVNLAQGAMTGLGECMVLPTSSYGSEYPYPLVGLDGLNHLFWRKNVPGGGMGMLHSRTKVNETAGESRVYQEVTLPVDMFNPTLSFIYWQGLNGNDEELGLQLSITDDQQTTTVFTGTRTSGWSYQWVDLSPWSGQDVTLDFSIEQKAGSEAAWAFIDEAFLGSAYSDSWTTLSAPQGTRPGESLVLTLQYGNNSTAVAEGSLLTVILPSEVSYVSALPAPVSHSDSQVVWDLGDITSEDGPGTITLNTAVSDTVHSGHLLSFSAYLSCNIPEIFESNNQDQANVFVTIHTYLPIVLR